MGFVYFLIGAVVLAIAILLAKEFADVAEQKGYPREKYFWYCFLLGLFGYLLVIALPNKGTAPEKQVSEELPDL